MTRRDEATYYLLSMGTIKRTVDLVRGGTVEFNESLCEHLAQELSNTNDFLNCRFVDLNVFEVQCESRRVALIVLYSVIKQAETLVKKCCKGSDSLWPERAFRLLAIKEDVLDIILHQRWWTSILDTVINSARTTSSSEFTEAESIESFKRADLEFETMLGDLTSSNSKLLEAAVKDRDCLLNKVVEFERSYRSHEPGTREHRAYLLSIQMYSLLTDNEAIRTPELNDFQVREVIGTGGLGVVSRVEWCGYDCALKTVQSSINSREIEEREARIQRSFQHPHIVQFFCHIWGAESEATWELESHIVRDRMSADLGEYMRSIVKGENPSQLKNIVGPDGKLKQTSESPFSNQVAIDIMLQVAKASRHMHSKNIIHRGLKTRNIFVRPRGEDEVPELSAQGFLQVKVGDFGVARDYNTMSSTEEPMTPRVGTAMYMSPEVVNFKSVDGIRRSITNYSHKTDLWTFGIMCAEVLSGVPPFQGMNLRTLEPMLERGTRPGLPEDCPDYLRFCIESCWEYRPEDRPEFLDIWRMLRFAKLRSLGLMDKNFDLFWFKWSQSCRGTTHTSQKRNQMSVPAESQNMPQHAEIRGKRPGTFC